MLYPFEDVVYFAVVEPRKDRCIEQRVRLRLRGGAGDVEDRNIEPFTINVDEDKNEFSRRTAPPIRLSSAKETDNEEAQGLLMNIAPLDLQFT